MEHSPTEGATVTPASTEPTGQVQEQQPAAELNQETSSGVQAQGSVSDGTATTQVTEATQTQQTSGEATDEGLAKFAKSQGVDDIAQLDDTALRFLKIAHDNQKAFREKTSGPKITDATKPLSGTDTEARLAQLEFERETDKFFDGKDRSIEGKMVEVLNEKRKQFGDAYAFSLSRDLDALYSLAGGSQSSVDVEAIRREERESINRKMSAGTPGAHATQGGASATPKVTSDWIENEYDPRNPEHVKLVDEFYSK